MKRFFSLLFVALVIASCGVVGEQALPTVTADLLTSYNTMLANELALVVDGECFTAAPSAYSLQFLSGIGASVEVSDSIQTGCVRIEAVKIGIDNPSEFVPALIKKEVGTLGAVSLIREQMDWQTIVRYRNAEGGLEYLILADWLGFLLADQPTRQLLLDLATMDGAMVDPYRNIPDWNRVINCDVIRQAHEVSLLPMTPTSPGGIAQIVNFTQCE